MEVVELVGGSGELLALGVEGGQETFLLLDRRVGLAPKPGTDYTQLVTDTLTLCGRILLTVVAKEVAPAGEFVDLFYGGPK